MKYRFKIEEDVDYDPATSVDWSEEDTALYVARFDGCTGDLAAFGVILEKLVPACDQCKRAADWEHAGSLWGIDVVTCGPGRDAMLDLGDGWHTVDDVDLPAPVSVENPGGSYLASILADLMSEDVAA